MLSSRLVHAAFKGVIQQIPFLGPVYQSITDEAARMAFERDVLAVLYEIARGSKDPKSEIVSNGPNAKLVQDLLETDAKLAERIITTRANPSCDKFLYLAATKYA